VLGAPAAADAQVTASLETAPLFDDEAGGEADADGPAVWVHGGATLVFGTKAWTCCLSRPLRSQSGMSRT
jgi:hypothetical protein